MTQDREIYRPLPEESISTAVVRAVADTRGVDPVDLDVRLYDYVDPCALNRLFAANGDASSRNYCASFTVADCHVALDGSRRIVVAPQADSVPAPETVDP
jgi:hypothetical protein